MNVYSVCIMKWPYVIISYEVFLSKKEAEKKFKEYRDTVDISIYVSLKTHKFETPPLESI